MTDSLDSFLVFRDDNVVVCKGYCGNSGAANAFEVPQRNPNGQHRTIGDYIRQAEAHLKEAHGGSDALEDDGSLNSLDVIMQLDALAIYLRDAAVTFELYCEAGEWKANFVSLETFEMLARGYGRVPTEAIAKLIGAIHGG